jgi:Nucleotidyl transferase AbiEii toxin, Type IV TA system
MIYLETISNDLFTVIDSVSKIRTFENFRLGGGTALALQLGHRISVDADFFSEKDFDRNECIIAIQNAFENVHDIHSGTHGVFMKIGLIKLDFLTWQLPFIKPLIQLNNWPLIGPEEIAAMKIFAILNRGEKKDYVDIAALLQDYSLQQIISFYQLRHPKSDSSIVLRYLASYSDLDNQPMPQMLNGLTWLDAKQIIKNSIQNFISNQP